MPNFLLAYHGGKEPESNEEAEAMMAQWHAWYDAMPEGMIVDAGNPIGQSHTVSAAGHVENGGANPISGYTILKCDDHEAACAIAAKNPVVGENGSVEVAEIHEV
ncbi:MAG: hypothetical protein ACU0CI_03285 [Shimia sp.]